MQGVAADAESDTVVRITTRASPVSLQARVVRLVAAWLMVAVGVPFLVRANLGVAPFDVLNTGLAHLTHWSLGTCFIVNSLGMFALGTLLGCPPGPASVLGTLAIGPMIDVALSLLPHPAALVPRIALLTAGLVILAVAISLVITTDLGAGPTEVVMLGLVRRGLGIVPARWISDGAPLVLGASLGGAVGAGTLLFLITMGAMVKIGLRRLHYVPSVDTGSVIPTSMAG